MTARILMVDDDADVRDVLSEVLIMGGYSVVCVGSGHEALRALEHDTFDLILSDLCMPEGDGLFLLQEVRHRHPTRPIVALISGYAEISEAQTAALGAQRVFTKPYDLDELLTGIRELLVAKEN